MSVGPKAIRDRSMRLQKLCRRYVPPRSISPPRGSWWQVVIRLSHCRASLECRLPAGDGGVSANGQSSRR